MTDQLKRNSDGERLTAVETDLSNLVESLNGFMVEFKVYTRDNDLRHRTPWGVLGTWAGVILTVCSLVGGIIAYGLNNKLDYMNEAIRRHEDNPAHYNAIETMARNDERIKAIERYVYRDY